MNEFWSSWSDDDAWEILCLLAWVWLIVAATGCGTADTGQPQIGRAWCCEVERADGPALECGVRHESPVLYCECNGVELGDLCLDPTHWTPGTACTDDAEMLCYGADE